MENEKVYFDLDVTIGKTWYKLVGVSLLSGVLVGAAVYFTGHKAFEAGFKQTTITPSV